MEPTLAGYAHEIACPELPVKPAATPAITDAPTRGRLFLGPQEAARKNALQELRNATVTGIVNCTLTYPNHHEKDDIEYCNVPVNDESGGDLLVYMEGASQFIEHHVSRGGSVLVHCAMGVSRSTTVVMAYLIRYHNLSREQAYERVKQCRPTASPNQGFWKELEAFEQRCNSQVTEEIKDDSNGPDSLFSAYFWEQLELFDGRWRQKEAPNETVQDDMNMIPDSFRTEQGIKQSLATFQTIGHLLEDPQERFPELSANLSVGANRMILFLALHFVYSRGILDADLKWFGALCRILTSTSGMDCAECIVSILTDDDSDFVEMWAGEIFSNDVSRIQLAIQNET